MSLDGRRCRWAVSFWSVLTVPRVGQRGTLPNESAQRAVTVPVIRQGHGARSHIACLPTVPGTVGARWGTVVWSCGGSLDVGVGEVSDVAVDACASGAVGDW